MSVFWGLKYECWQVTGKLNYAQSGTYLIYRGAVVGSKALMSFCSTASFINLEILPADVLGTPKRSLGELLVNASSSVLTSQ